MRGSFYGFNVMRLVATRLRAAPIFSKSVERELKKDRARENWGRDERKRNLLSPRPQFSRARTFFSLHARQTAKK